MANEARKEYKNPFHPESPLNMDDPAETSLFHFLSLRRCLNKINFTLIFALLTKITAIVLFSTCLSLIHDGIHPCPLIAGSNDFGMPLEALLIVTVIFMVIELMLFLGSYLFVESLTDYFYDPQVSIFIILIDIALLVISLMVRGELDDDICIPFYDHSILTFAIMHLIFIVWYSISIYIRDAIYDQYDITPRSLSGRRSHIMRTNFLSLGTVF